MDIDSFCGATFNGGHLRVVGISSVTLHGVKKYACVCDLCALDPELNGSATYEMTKHNLSVGRLPCSCSANNNWTPSQYKVLLSRSGLGKYRCTLPNSSKIRCNTRASCRCVLCNHAWESDISNLLHSGQGCPKCAEISRVTSKSKSIDDANDAISIIARTKGWTFDPITSWDGVNRTHVDIRCQCGCKWNPTFSNVVYLDIGCPNCAQSGYTPPKPGTFYIYEWRLGCHAFLKYGITNQVKSSRRVAQQKKKTDYVPHLVFHQSWDDGNVAAYIERFVDDYKKSRNIPHQVSSDEFGDGWTETLPLDRLADIMQIVETKKPPEGGF